MAPVQGVIYTWQTTVNALVGLYQTFAGLFERKGLPAGAAFAGPIGITIFLANAASYGIGFFLIFYWNNFSFGCHISICFQFRRLMVGSWCFC